jgi:hypothetical protein
MNACTHKHAELHACTLSHATSTATVNSSISNGTNQTNTCAPYVCPGPLVCLPDFREKLIWADHSMPRWGRQDDILRLRWLTIQSAGRLDISRVRLFRTCSRIAWTAHNVVLPPYIIRTFCCVSRSKARCLDQNLCKRGCEIKQDAWMLSLLK